MNPRSLFFSGVALVLQIPLLAYAQGLVPCGGDGQEACQMCHSVQLINEVTAWLVGLLSVVAAVMFVIAGLRIVTAQGNPSVLKDAKSMIVNVAIGFVIVLTAWLLIDLLLKTLLGDGEVAAGPWNTIACINQPTATTKEGNLGTFEQVRLFIDFPTVDTSRGTAFNTGGSIDPTILPSQAALSFEVYPLCPFQTSTSQSKHASRRN